MEFIFDDPIESNDEFEYNANSYNGFERSVPRQRRVTRRGVANGMDEVEFTAPVRTRRKARPKITYETTARQKKIFEWRDLTWTKAAWAFLFILVLRLIFMENGVLDYHNMNQTIGQKIQHLKELRVENANLVKEINRIKTSSSYQKRMAREHLGVIAPDEYLVVFSK